MLMTSKGLFARPATDWMQQATNLRAADTVRWQRILFMAPNWVYAHKSLVDDNRFFFSPQGKTDPQSELNATIVALLNPESHVELAGGTHPLCIFPARQLFLQEVVGIPTEEFPKVACDSLREWLTGRQFPSVSMVFSAFYPDNPSSMFGHSFLHFYRRTQTGTVQSFLNDDALNFAGVPGDTNALTFAWGGITGGFPGVFSLDAYFVKLQEYNNLESRDLWEYGLDLTPAEIQRLMLSLWEVAWFRINYYYFDDNCSYMMLALLETARDQIHLTAQIPFWVTPSDATRVAVKALARDQEPRFYPSARSRYLERFQYLDHSQQQQMRRFFSDGQMTQVLDEIRTDTPVRQRRFLDAGIEHIDFTEKLGGNKVAKQYATQRHALLLARSRIAEASDPLTRMPREQDPVTGHPTSRVSVGLSRENKTSAYEFRVMPALHELMDDPQGYSNGMAIAFTDLRLQYIPRWNRVRLRSLDLLRIASLRSREALVQPLSWTLTIGSEQEALPTSQAQSFLHSFIRSGAGWSGELHPRVTAYALGLGEVGYSEVPGLYTYAGVGSQVGLLAQVAAHWRARLQLQWLRARGQGQYQTRRDGEIHLAYAPQARQQWELSWRDRNVSREVYGSWSWFY